MPHHSSWPSAILHLDADSFFASVEQAVNPRYKGKPVVTGLERGIVSAASVEAKKMGVSRAISLVEARKMCPGLICLPSDYETYSLFSKKIFSVMRQYTPMVEEYSIDEGFADLKGTRRIHHASYEEIAVRMKEDVEKSLGITVSVGLSLTKSLAKLCSKFNKPSGTTSISGKYIHDFLRITPLRSVWGFGSNTTALLQKFGMATALDFISQDRDWVEKYLGKTGLEIYEELSGNSLYSVDTEEKSSYYSISKVKTFTPPSKNKDFVFSQALRNLESACLKARRYDLKATEFTLYLRTHNFQDEGLKIKLSRPTSSTHDFVEPLQNLFRQVYQSGTLYRSTGVILGGLSSNHALQMNFFEEPLKIINVEKVSQAIDMINSRYGKHAIHLAASMPATHRFEGDRATLPERKSTRLLKGETFRQRLNVPVMGIV